jgi:hypothetical protein
MGDGLGVSMYIGPRLLESLLRISLRAALWLHVDTSFVCPSPSARLQARLRPSGYKDTTPSLPLLT